MFLSWHHLPDDSKFFQRKLFIFRQFSFRLKAGNKTEPGFKKQKNF